MNEAQISRSGRLELKNSNVLQRLHLNLRI